MLNQPVVVGTGQFCARRPGWVVAVWAGLTVLAGLLVTGGVGSGLFPRLSTPTLSVPGEAREGAQVLARATGSTQRSGPTSMLLVRGVPQDFAVATTISDGAAALSRVPGVQRVSHPYDGDPVTAVTLDNPDRQALLVVAALRPGLSAAAQDAARAQVDRRLQEMGHQLTRDNPRAHTEILGSTSLTRALNQQAATDLRRAELLALPLTLILLIVVFRGLVAATLPVVSAAVSIVCALGLLTGLAGVMGLDATVVNVVSLVGLGLSIDYSLLMVGRFREELADADVPDAVAATCRTAGRTVVFSGTTVSLALCALLVFRTQALVSVAVAGVCVVVMAMLVSLTLVPALLGVGGRRLARPPRPGEGGWFTTIGRGVQRHPWWVLILAGGLLVLLTLPAARLTLRNSTVDLLPPDDPVRHSVQTLRQDFPDAQPAAITVVARDTGQPAATALAAWGRRIGQQVPGVDSVVQRDVAGGRSTLQLRLKDPEPGSAQAIAIVQRLRKERAVASWVTGPAATMVDLDQELRGRAPAALLVMMLAVGFVMFLMTASLVMAVKAVAMSLLSLGATLGVMVWGFQDGHLAGPLGLPHLGGVETVIVPTILVLGFGLAMDYEVFLLERIRQARATGTDTREAVVLGLQGSGRIITSAALVLMVVFACFAGGQLFVIRQVALALAFTVLVDATVVRLLLVPAVLTILGDRAWWTPLDPGGRLRHPRP